MSVALMKGLVVAVLLGFCGFAVAQDTQKYTNIRMDPADPIPTQDLYTDEMKRAGEQGRCVVRIHVSKTGIASDAAIEQSTGFSRLDEACKLALNGHHLFPATVNGDAVDKYVDIPIVWKLNTAPPPLVAEVSPSGRDANGNFVIHGVPRNCRDISSLDDAYLESARSGGKIIGFYSGWSSADFDVAIEWVNACANYGRPDMRSIRRFALQDQKQRAEMDREQQAATQRAQKSQQEFDEKLRFRKEEGAARIEERRRKQEAEDAEDASRAAAFERCEKTREYALFQIQENIIAEVTNDRIAHETLERQKKIAEISGTENLALKYSAGNTIVTVEENLAKDWPKYKALGGQAESPQKVTHTLRNHCQQSSE